ncbi:MAG TPA: HisA/HisF-related TIM barrel protein [Acidimicrobiales bacterium]|nr:HisA/HisF-related TIM barrel protein [Acidimicrobiales bacterium]
MELFAAIDLRDGAAVRLVQGDFSRQRGYGDPVALARRYVEGGARWIHMVDLDAARTGAPVNRDTVLAVAAAVDVRLQVGGGVRSAETAAALLDGGVTRVVLGTSAVGDPDLVRALADRYPARVAVGLDHRGGGAQVAVAGWEKASDSTVADVLDLFCAVPLAAVIVTAIERDGAMSGPDLDGLRAVLEATTHDVVASGGVRGAADLATLAHMEAGGRRLAGAIVGTALVEGAVSVEEAIAACAASG